MSVNLYISIDASEHTIQMLKSSAPIFSFTRVDDQTFTFELQTGSKIMTSTFKLGEEHEMERRDGSKVRNPTGIKILNVVFMTSIYNYHEEMFKFP